MTNNKSTKGETANKSAAIRDALIQNPKASSKDVVSLLEKKGVKVTPTMVYYMKSKQIQANRKKKRTDAAAMSESIKVKNPVELVMKVKQLAHEVGGIKNLKKLIDLLAE